jgi:hypothetical protein
MHCLYSTEFDASYLSACHRAIFRCAVGMFLIALICSLDINNIRLKYKSVFITSKYFVHQIIYHKYLNIFSLYDTSVWDDINKVFTFMRFVLRLLLGSFPQKLTFMIT